MEKLKILIVEDDKILITLYDKFLGNDVFDDNILNNKR